MRTGLISLLTLFEIMLLLAYPMVTVSPGEEALLHSDICISVVEYLRWRATGKRTCLQVRLVAPVIVCKENRIGVGIAVPVEVMMVPFEDTAPFEFADVLPKESLEVPPFKRLTAELGPAVVDCENAAKQTASLGAQQVCFRQAWTVALNLDIQVVFKRQRDCILQ